MANGELDLEKLYEDHYSKVYNYIFYRLLKREETEDLVSTVFLKIARNLHSYDPKKAQVSTWVQTITANTLRDYYRTRKQNISLDDESFAGSEPAVEFEDQYEQILSPTRRALFQALATLPERERVLIYNKYFLHMQNRELAAQLGVNESTLASALLRARKKLREALGSDSLEYMR